MSAATILRREDNGMKQRRVWDLLKAMARGMLVIGLACWSGCARSDWIERTLVTVDVRGTWEGTASSGALWQFNLEQEGTRVRGSWRRLGAVSGTTITTSGSFEGTVTGDLVTFSHGSVTGEMRVRGEEMSGSLLSGGGNSPVTLRRLNSPPRPM
jgi:hypothetical protein